MAGKKVTTDLTEQQAQDCMEKLAVALAEVRKLKLMLEHYAKTNGGFSHAGLHLYETQTMRQSFDTRIVGAALDELGAKWETLAHLFPATLINKLVLQTDYGADIRAYLKLEPSEGMILAYGKPTLAVRTNAPDEAKVHILQPGDKPLTTTAAEIDETPSDWGDTNDMEDAPLSPGD
jgi:hypothetical protein